MMITLNEVKQISSKVSLENMGVSDSDLSENLSCIAYRIDVFECGDTFIIDRHIDIEYSSENITKFMKTLLYFNLFVPYVVCHCMRKRKLSFIKSMKSNTISRLHNC